MCNLEIYQVLFDLLMIKNERTKKKLLIANDNEY